MKGFVECFSLLYGKPDLASGLCPLNGPGGVERRTHAGLLCQNGQAMADPLLRLAQRGKIDGGLPIQRLTDHRVLFAKIGEGILKKDLSFDPQKLGSLLIQAGGGIINVSRLGSFIQEVEQTGGKPLGRIFGKADGCPNPVGGLEPDTCNLTGQVIGILPNPLRRMRTIGFEDPESEGGGNLMLLQKEHESPQVALFNPGSPNASQTRLADPVYRQQTLRLFFDHLQRLGAEGFHQPLGVGGADSLDET